MTRSATSPFFLNGLIAAVVIILFDQVSKYFFLHIMELPHRPPIEVLPFFDLVMVWNRGVSFGMFSGEGSYNAFILAAVAAVITGMLLYWMHKAENNFMALALGLVIGGALGNIVDRFLYGAVADFFDVHVAGWHWPAFNIADSAICIGVALLVWDTLTSSKQKA